LDRAGLVGEDGATHHGVFDIAYLRCIPNIIIATPSNETELRNLLYTAQLDLKLPMAIRYPRGRGIQKEWETPFEEVEIGKARCLQQGDRIAVLSIGNMLQNATKAIKKVKNEMIGHYDMRFVKPLDEEVLHSVFKSYKAVITIEDGVVTGGFGSAVLEFAAKHDYKAKIRNLGLPDEFIEQGNIDELQEIAKINVQYIEEEIVSLVQNL
ncbi:MAG: transketolase C-terminal domain-containing protein, partial [Salegentibacter mishustinae]|nr:transketolase C-terminal domain-containing protein [Salegentibacter mishustinae]